MGTRKKTTRTTKKPPTKRERCPIEGCDYKATTLAGLVRHQKAQHQGERVGKDKAGRPRVEIDPDQVFELAKIKCSQKQIASVLKCSQTALTERFKSDPELREAYERGRDEGDMGVLRAQYESAIGGNVTAQIWYGKQHLGQRDRRDLTHAGPDGGPVEVRNMKGLSDEELRKIAEGDADGDGGGG